MRGFAVARSEFFDYYRPYVLFLDKKSKFSTACVRVSKKSNQVVMSVSPVEMKFAVHTAVAGGCSAVVFPKLVYVKYQLSHR